MVDISIIVPCYNEEENINELVTQIREAFQSTGLGIEIVLVNDGSSDRTKERIDEICSSDVVGIHHDVNKGITEAWHSGLEHSRGKYVVTIDADLQYMPKDIVTLYEHIKKNGCDLVQGWRKIYKDTSPLRRFLSRFLSWFLNIIFRTRIEDIKSGFVIYKRDVFVDILRDRNEFLLYQHFFLLCALAKGYRVEQVPIVFHPRERGTSFISHPLLFSYKVLLDMPKAIVYYKIRANKKRSS